jgi:integrase
MAKAAFTARWVTFVKPPATGQVDYFDTRPPSLGLRVSSSGRKTWFIMYRSGGRLRRLTFGTYPALGLADARSQAATARHTVAQGNDPAVEKHDARHAPSVSDIASQYLTLYAKVQKKSWRDDARLLHREVLSHWGHRKAFDITRRDVLVLLDQIVQRGAPIQANRVLALIRKLYNWAISRDLIEHNPCIQVKPPGKEHQRDRVLNDDEIRLVWNATEQLDPPTAAQLRLRLLTAQRGGEVRTMRWEDIDMESGWWTIPARIAKNGLSHRVPLSRPVLDLLSHLQAIIGESPWVFPSGRRQGRPIVDVRKSAKRVCNLSGVVFVPHDLRRTAASHMAGMGISRLVVGKILNHAEPGVTKVYDRHSYDAEKRQALNAWGERVMELVTARDHKVLHLLKKP